MFTVFPPLDCIFWGQLCVFYFRIPCSRIVGIEHLTKECLNHGVEVWGDLLSVSVQSYGLHSVE